MKHISTIAAIATLAATMSVIPMSGQTRQSVINVQKEGGKIPDVVLQKGVSGPDSNGNYTLTLESFATGATTTSTTYQTLPNDIVIVVDYSWSMANNNVQVEKRQLVPAGTELEPGTEYRVDVDGKIYKMKGFEGTGSVGTYTPLESQPYTYNGYGNKTYYYKQGDEYYPVTRSTFTSGYAPVGEAGTTYSYTDYGNYKYYYKVGDNYYLVSRDNYASPAYYTSVTSSAQNYTYNNYGSNEYYYTPDGKNYYQVNRTTFTSTPYYNARSSQSYTYNGYGSNQYYYKDGSNYYPVSRGSGKGYEPTTSSPYGYAPTDQPLWIGDRFYLYEGQYYKISRGTYNGPSYVNATSGYSYNNINNNKGKYYFYYQGKWYKVEAGSDSNGYCLYFVTDQGQTLYIREDDVVSTTKKTSSYKYKTTTIWNRNLAIYDSDSAERYCFTFVKDGVTYYLQQDGSASTTPFGVTNSGVGDSRRTVNICYVILYNQNNTDYYCLKYTDNSGATHYLKSDGSTTTTPSGASSTLGTIYSGVLYQYGDTYYGMTYTNGGTTYYLKSDGTSTTSPTGPTSNGGTIYNGLLYKMSQDNMLCLSYTVGSTKFYLTPAGASTTTQTGNVSETATLYTGLLYKEAQYYAMTYKVGDKTYYLTPDGSSSETPSGDLDAANTLYDGVLYVSDSKIYSYRYGTTTPANISSGTDFATGPSKYVVSETDKIYIVTGTDSKTRLKVAKESVQEFINVVANKKPDKVDGQEQQYHKLAVVGFNSNAFTVVELGEVTETSKTTMINTVENYSQTEMSTQPDKGLDLASGIFANVADDGRKKIVIFFTDGAPGTNNSFDATYATKAVKSSYNLKKKIADGGYEATVYSIACLGTSDMNSQNMLNFLHFVSSNYPDETGTSVSYTRLSGEAMQPHDYMQVSDGSDLSTIFSTIAHQASSGGAAIKLDATTGVVIDVVTKDFYLPYGADASKINVYTAPLTGHPSTTDNTGNYQFGDLVALEGATVTVDNTTQKISVSGYDFTSDDNWVGPRDGAWVDGKGRELVIQIPIALSPDCAGGMVYTNTKDSGVYRKIDDTKLEEIDTYTPPYMSIGILVIKKEGMAQGESAVFKVTDSDNKAYDVILTGNATGDPQYAVLYNLPYLTSAGNANKFTVTETSWSWAYQPVSAKNKTFPLTTDKKNIDNFSSVLSNVTVDGKTVKCLYFEFANTAKEDTPKHAEANVKNDFEKQTTTTTKTVKQ